MERRKIMLMLVILAILGILAALSTDRTSLHTYEVTYEWVWEDGSHEVFVDTLLAPGEGALLERARRWMYEAVVEADVYEAYPTAMTYKEI